jgi:hypothetical protein
VPEPLPTHPDLGQLRTRAKELRRAVSRRVPDALARVAASHPGYAERPIEPARFTLRDAQATIAHESGFGSWHDLVHEVGTRRVEERDLHRWFGVELNNDTWDLLDTAGEGLAPADQERMLYGAIASTYHWIEAGTAANHARGEYLIGQVALAIGRPELALHHAERCLELVESEPDVMADWDLPFAHEVRARARLATGDVAGARADLARAEELAAEIADPEDKAVVDDALAKGDWGPLRSG